MKFLKIYMEEVKYIPRKLNTNVCTERQKYIKKWKKKQPIKYDFFTWSLSSVFGFTAFLLLFIHVFYSWVVNYLEFDLRWVACKYLNKGRTYIKEHFIYLNLQVAQVQWTSNNWYEINVLHSMYAT